MDRTAFGGRLAQTMLRVLAVHRGSTVTRDALVEHLWPERTPADPAANLNVLASRIRRATGAPWLVVASAGGFLLPHHDSCVVDSERFLSEVQAARTRLDRGQVGEALHRFEAALGRWTGEPLVEDLYAEWAQPYRRALEQAHLAALEGTATAALAIGDPPLALRRAEEAVAEDPLRESAHLLRVRALAESGHPAAAADAYAAFRRHLAEETGLEPSAAARELHGRLLRGEVRPRAPRTAPARLRPASGPVADLPFVGRDDEVDTVLRETHEGGLVVVEGVSGAGKSRLLAEVARRAGRAVVTGRAFLPERDEAWALARHLLREFLTADVAAARALPDRMAGALADVLPELEDLRPLPTLVLEPDSRRALTLEGALRLADAALGRGLLLLDDLQWADASSLALVDRIRVRLPGVAMVLAYRPEDVRPDGAVQALLDGVRHTGPVPTVTLLPLRSDALRHLIADDAVAAAIAEHTDRTPMAVAEVVRALARRAALVRREDGRWSPTGSATQDLVADAARTGQRRALEARVAGQPPAVRDLVHLLALLGRESAARTLADALGRSQPEVLEQLDRLARAGLVRLGDRGWAPAHDMVAESVIAALDPAAAGRLHGLLARTLADEDADRAEVARHLAGAGDRDPAAAAFAAASRDRLQRYADREAAELAGAGLLLDPAATVRGALLEVRAEARARSGDLAGAGEDLREALRTGVTGPARARLLARHARLAAGAEDLAYAAELVHLALTETTDDPRVRAAALYAGAIIDMNIDQPERARQRSNEALRLFEEAGDSRGVADILDARAMATFLEGRNGEALAQFDRVARLFSDAGDLLRVVTPRSTRGHGLVFLGEPAQALADTEQAVELARSLGYAEGVSYALWHRSEALSALGRIEESIAAAEEALDIAEQLGHRSWVVSAHRALGIALQSAGELKPAEQAFCRGLALATHWPLFVSWSCARIALVRLAEGDVEAAEPYVTRALAEGPPLAHFEARLAHAELTTALGRPDAEEVARDALRRAVVGGHLVGVPRLTELAAAAATRP